LIVIKPVHPKIVLKDYCGEWMVILFVNDLNLIVKITCYQM